MYLLFFLTFADSKRQKQEGGNEKEETTCEKLQDPGFFIFFYM